MKRCGILCYFSDEFYKNFKREKLHFYRFKEDLIKITSELIYSGCGIFAVGGATEAYRDIMQEFFECCSIISRVDIEVVNNNFTDYLIDECDEIFIFWKDDENWDNLWERIEKKKKPADLYDMDSVTDEYRNTDKYLKLIAEDDKDALINGRDIDFLRRYNINYDLKKRK